MFTRVGGATLALVAAVSLALSIAGALGPLPGWWSGHPNVQGTVIRAKYVDIGLLRTKGCNTGGDRTCQSVEVPGLVAKTGYAAAGATGLLAAATALLGIAAALERERRRSLAKLAVLAVVVAGLAAIALIAQGPGLEARTPDNRELHVSVPLGIGTYLFAGGMLSAIVASALAMRAMPGPRRSLPRDAARSPGARYPAPPAPSPDSAPVNVEALLQDDALRPAALGPEPMMGSGGRPAPPPPPGPPAFPGAGGPPMGGAPLFSAAPQLRPLYDAAPHVGGTGGFVPSSQLPPMMMRAPTPIPRDQISARAGIPTPAAFEAPPELAAFGRGGAAARSDGPESPGLYDGRDGRDGPEQRAERAERAEPDPLEAAIAAFAAPPQPRRQHSLSQPPPPAAPPPAWSPAPPPAAMAQEPVQRRGSTALGAPPAPTPTAPMLPAPAAGSPASAGPPPLFPGSVAPAPSAESRSPKTLPPPIRGKSLSSPPLSVPPPAAAPPPPSPLRPGPRAAAPPTRPPPSAPLTRSPPIPPPLGARPSPASRPPPLGGPAGATGAPAPFVPTVPFPAPSAKARMAARPPTDPLERASTEAFADDATQDRGEDSTLALLRGVGDATGVVDAPPEFESQTLESGLLAGRPGPSPDEIETGAIERVHPTDLDLPLVKPPPTSAAAADGDDGAGDDDASPSARAETVDHRPATVDQHQAPVASAPAAGVPAPKPDRLSRGLRAFGIRPTERDGDGKFRATGNLHAAAPAAAPERPLTSPLIPPPSPSPSPAAAAPAPAPAAPAAPDPLPAPPAPAGAGEPAKLPITTASASLPPPSEKQSATSGPSPACPQCEAPMAWVEEHLRFYCKSCKMYF